ncbi:MAG: glycosyltransferase family 2 protein [Rickettsia endosymbiont of Bryobia graminum]|nr:glycosyltransferase family 2 protein [Rickettsia endosymbiont of Bryobia graminum]
MKLSIIIPCFNEEIIINSTVSAIIDYMSNRLSNVDYELLIINDGSTDNTLAQLAKIENANLKVINLPYNQGRGKAIKTGTLSSKGEFVITLDADLSYDVEHIEEIMQQFEQDKKIDAVIVSPYMKNGIIKNVPIKRLLVSRIANWLLSDFFDNKISTVTCVVRGYKGDLIRKIPLLEDGKELHLEILYKLSLYQSNVKEIPGRLIWKNSKRELSHKTNFKFVNSGEKHLLYAITIKPTKVFIFLTLLLLTLGAYEFLIIFSQIYKHLDFTDNSSVSLALWKAINYSFTQSPHSFYIALGSSILGFITFCMLILLYVSKSNHEQVMKHLLILLEKKNDKV